MLYSENISQRLCVGFDDYVWKRYVEKSIVKIGRPIVWKFINAGDTLKWA